MQNVTLIGGRLEWCIVYKSMSYKFITFELTVDDLKHIYLGYRYKEELPSRKHQIETLLENNLDIWGVDNNYNFIVEYWSDDEYWLQAKNTKREGVVTELEDGLYIELNDKKELTNIKDIDVGVLLGWWD